MATLADAFGKAGPGTTKIIGDKTWTLVRASKGIQAKWGVWLADRTETAVMDTAEKYRKRARKLWRDAENLEEVVYGDDPLSQEAKDEMAAQHDDMTREAAFLELEAKKIVERFHDRKGSGEFEYHGNVGIFTAQRGLPGRFQLAWLCLQQHHPGITMDEVIDAHTNHVDEWGDFLMESQGVSVKNADAPPAAASPAANPTSEPTTATSSQPNADPQ